LQPHEWKERQKQLKEMVQEMKKKAIWEDQAHPELQTVDDVISYINHLRENGWRRRDE